MSDQKKDIREIIKEEYIKCMSSPSYFIKKYCQISHPMRGKIPFHLYKFQEKTLDIIKGDKNSIILKSRQLGISTLVAAYILWLILFFKDKNILVIATKQETAKNMVTKVTFMYDNLPSWLKGKDKPKEKNKLSLKLINNSQVKATSAASDAGRSEAVSLLVFDEGAFIEGVESIWTSAQSTLSTGGKCITLSTPYGTGNWFHKTWVAAEEGTNGWNPIKLPWFVHPERDQKWRDKQDIELGPKEAAQECDCEFNTSGDVVFHNDWLTYALENTVQEPISYRGIDNNLWIWENVDYSKEYLVVADVARGDGADFSACHVIDIKSNTQVAEFKGQMTTRDFGYFLVGLASEYNNALLVVENNNIGWSTIEAILERGYNNLYYSSKNEYKNQDDFVPHNEGGTSQVPGFSNNLKTRPLCINKLREYIGENSLIIRSKRLISEMRVFIWKNGRAEAQSGYNDDLVISMAIAMFLRDTSLKFHQNNLEMTRAALNSIKNYKPDFGVYRGNHNNYIPNPYEMNIGNDSINLKWLL